jgi:chromosome segregation ATPase
MDLLNGCPECGELCGGCDPLEQIEIECAQLRSELEEVNFTNENLFRENQEQRVEIEGLKNQCDIYHSQQVEDKDELDKLYRTNKEIYSELEKLRAEVERLEYKNDTVTMERNKYETQRNQLRATLELVRKWVKEGLYFVDAESCDDCRDELADIIRE